MWPKKPFLVYAGTAILTTAVGAWLFPGSWGAASYWLVVFVLAWTAGFWEGLRHCD